MTRILTCALLACLADVALAQQAPAQRYIDAQGVEIIQNRDAARPSAVASGRVAPVPKAAAATGAASDPKLQVGAAEQAARDLDRAAILREELAHETRKFEAASRALVQSEKAARTQQQDPATLKQLNELLHTHQQNIQSITAELQRAGVQR